MTPYLPSESWIFLCLGALFFVPIVAFLLRQSCAVFGEGMPNYRRAMAIVVLTGVGAYLTWDGTSYALIKMAKEAVCRDGWFENQAVLEQRKAWIDQIDYSHWVRLPLQTRFELTGRVPGVSRLPFVFGLCFAGFVTVVGLNVPFRLALGIVLLQWLMVIVVAAVGQFAVGTGLRMALPATHSLPTLATAEEKARKVWQAAFPAEAVAAGEASAEPAWKSLLNAAAAASGEANSFVEPYQNRMMEQLDPYLRWLPEDAHTFLKQGGIWLVVGVALIVILIWLRGMSKRLWRALRKGRSGRKKPVALQKFELAGFSKLGVRQGDRRLSVRHLPARLRLVVLAPAGSDSGELHSGMAESILDCCVPGLGEIADSDNPTVVLWPRQYSLEGFQHALFAHVNRPEGDPKRSRYALLGGPIVLGKFAIHVGMAIECDDICALGNIRIGKDRWTEAVTVTRKA